MLNRILVIGAHYDDAELGAGGAMAKWIDAGKEVYKITLTDNVTDFKKKHITINHKSSVEDSANACKILGVTEVYFPVMPCTELQFNKKQMQLIEGFIIDKKIDTVIIHNQHDIQQDHVEASKISYVAGRYCSNILMYQGNKYVLPRDYYPRLFVDITSTIEKKKQALDQYGHGHDRYKQLFKMIIEQNKGWGYSAFINAEEKYAEAFLLIKMII